MFLFLFLLTKKVLEAKEGTISVASAFPGHQEGNCQLFIGFNIANNKWPLHSCYH